MMRRRPAAPDALAQHLVIELGTGPEFYDRAAATVADVVDAHELDYEPVLAKVLTDVFIRGAMLGVAEVTATLVEHGIDARVDFDQATLTR